MQVCYLPCPNHATYRCVLDHTHEHMSCACTKAGVKTTETFLCNERHSTNRSSRTIHAALKREQAWNVLRACPIPATRATAATGAMVAIREIAAPKLTAARLKLSLAASPAVASAYEHESRAKVAHYHTRPWSCLLSPPASYIMRAPAISSLFSFP